MPYALKIDEFSKMIGSKNESLLGQIKISGEPYFDKLNASMGKKGGWQPCNGILDYLLGLGSVGEVANWAKHWYVIELLVGAFGRPLDCDDWKAINPGVFLSSPYFRPHFLGADVELELGVPEGKPAMYLIRNSSLMGASTFVNSQKISLVKKQEFDRWINEAHEQKSDLVLFEY